MLCNPSFAKKIWGGGTNKYRTEVCMYGGFRVSKFRVRHSSWRIVHHHRMGVVDTAAAWVRLEMAFWEPVHGGYIELQIYKEFKQDMGHNVQTKYRRGSRFPGTLYEGRKEVQRKNFHWRISPSQLPIVFNRRIVRVYQIEADKEEYVCQGVGARILPT